MMDRMPVLEKQFPLEFNAEPTALGFKLDTCDEKTRLLMKMLNDLCVSW
jgi:hypothetical protein